MCIRDSFKGMHGKKFAEGLAAGGNAEFYIAVPSDITEVEKRAFFDLIASSSLKTKKIRIVEKPIADALGAGLDVMDATGRLIVNIGADTTEISLISLGGIVQSRLLSLIHIYVYKRQEQHLLFVIFSLIHRQEESF